MPGNMKNRRVFSVLCVLAGLLGGGYLFPPEASSFEARRVSAAPDFQDRDIDREIREAKREFRRFARSLNVGLAKEFLKRFTKIDHPKIVPYLVKVAILVPSRDNYEKAVRAIARFSGKDTLDQVLRLSSRAKDFRERVLILEALGRRKKKTKTEDIRRTIYTTLRNDRVVHVRVAAIHACIERREKEAIPVLFEHAEKYRRSRNRDWIEARQALYDLTGQNFEAVEDWRNFWAAHKDRLDPRKVRQQDDNPARRQVTVVKTDDTVQFFGAEINSRSVVFVIDISGSMMRYDADPTYDGANEERDRQRLFRAKRQTIQAIGNLRPGSRFNVIAFNTRVFSWKDRMVNFSRSNVKDARKFANSFRAASDTQTHKALERAFEDKYVDTIVLLSDGAPYKFEFNHDQNATLRYQEEILERVRDLNAGRNLTIHTFGFEGSGRLPGRGGGGGGGGGNRGVASFLTKLAEENGGVYRPIR